MVEQGGTAGRTETGKVVENRFANFAGTQVGIEGVGETVGFVAQALEELQARMGETEI